MAERSTTDDDVCEREDDERVVAVCGGDQAEAKQELLLPPW